MIALTKKTKKSVRFIRTCIEFSVLIAGYLLGGSIGFGTILMVFGSGYFVQFAFIIFKFDVKEVKHQFINDYIKLIYSRLGLTKKLTESQSIKE